MVPSTGKFGRLLVVVAFLLGLGAGGAGLIGRVSRAGAGATLSAAEGAEPVAEGGKIKALLQQRLAVLTTAVEQVTTLYQRGIVPIDRLQKAHRNLVDAELDLCETNAQRIAVLEKCLALAKQSEQIARQSHEAGRGTQFDLLTITADRLAVEIALERAKEKKGEE